MEPDEFANTQKSIVKLRDNLIKHARE
jgi:hypothetical protein